MTASDTFLDQLKKELEQEIENLTHYVERRLGYPLSKNSVLKETPKEEEPPTSSRWNVYEAIRAERERAHVKHVANGKSVETRNFFDSEWLPILTEEVGEVAREICDSESVEHLRDELVQVAAMAAAWADSCTRFIDDGKELNV